MTTPMEESAVLTLEQGGTLVEEKLKEFKFETAEDNPNLIYVDDWFKSLGVNFEDWQSSGRVRAALHRFSKLADEPIIGKELIRTAPRPAVHKFLMMPVLEVLNNAEIGQLIKTHAPDNIVTILRNKSLRIRLVDGSFSADTLLNSMDRRVDEFLASDHFKALTTVFGKDIVSTMTVEDAEGIAHPEYWLDIICLLPTLIWLNSFATFELFGFFFMNHEVLPNTDLMKGISEKHNYAMAEYINKVNLEDAVPAGSETPAAVPAEVAPAEASADSIEATPAEPVAEPAVKEEDLPELEADDANSFACNR